MKTLVRTHRRKGKIVHSHIRKTHSKPKIRRMGFRIVSPSKKDISQLERLNKERHVPIGSSLQYPLLESLEMAKGYPKFEKHKTLYPDDYAKAIRETDKANLKLIKEDGVVKGAMLRIRNPEDKGIHIQSIVIPNEFKGQGVAKATVHNLLKDEEIDKLWLEPSSKDTKEIWQKVGFKPVTDYGNFLEINKTGKVAEVESVGDFITKHNKELSAPDNRAVMDDMKKDYVEEVIPNFNELSKRQKEIIMDNVGYMPGLLKKKGGEE